MRKAYSLPPHIMVVLFLVLLGTVVYFALEIWGKSLGKNHPNTATFSKNLAFLLRKTNRETEAQEMEERARGIRGGRKGN